MIRWLNELRCVVRGHWLWEDRVHTSLGSFDVEYCSRCPYFKFVE